MPTINGTANNDELNGTPADDRINGLGGNDIIRGGGGADIIDAGDGDDEIYILGPDDAVAGDETNGGAGSDTVYVSGDAGPEGEEVRYSIANVALTGVETLVSWVVAGVTQAQISSVSTITGGFYLVESGAITFTGLTTNGLSVQLNPGGNQLDLRGLTSTNYSLTVTGSDVADTVFGSPVSDTISGGGGNDILRGEGGGDSLSGGAGDDLLIGGAGADNHVGNAGRDTILGTAAELNGDTLLDFTSEDRVVVSDATLAGFSLSIDRQGGLLNYTGGSLRINIFLDGTYAASAAPEGGVQITFIRDVANDFNHDGRSDILWRHDNGTIGDWLANANGSFAVNGASVTGVPNYWQIAGTGDFNGDGRDDLLWRGQGGEVGNWLASANGSFSYNAAAGVVSVPSSWQVVGVGDFDGDGRDDILWRNGDGTVGNWLGNADGSFTANNANVRSSSLTMHVAAIGDFNGDKFDDVLWRDANGTFVYWIGSGSGAFFSDGASRVTTIGNDWHIIGAGDFNGDGYDDILWRHDDGRIANWQGQAFGWTPNNSSVTAVTNDWSVVGIGDYNGDGRDDILWRHDSGTVGTWLANEAGVLAFNPAGGLPDAPNEWQVEDAAILVV